MECELNGPDARERAMHVGFVGTGNMGGPMATNVLKAGHQLTVFDARAEATAPLEKLGARRAPDLPAVAAAVEVTLTRTTPSWRRCCSAPQGRRV
jgi:3-hydroxyisobutyrate dehydrogenase-like beta-hydroxyacid dehydrogenase